MNDPPPGDSFGMSLSGCSDNSGSNELAELAAIIESLSDEEAAILMEAIISDDIGAQPGCCGVEQSLSDEYGGDVDLGLCGETYEPDFGEDELAAMMLLAQAANEDEYKEAAYYGMSIPEYRLAKDETGELKQAMLQAKNAEQGKKAKRYGQSIDSLIR